MPAAKNIFIFGDSITYGEWDAAGGWANRLREYYDAPQLPLPKKYNVTYNLGIPSDTSVGLAQRLTAETQARLSPNPNVVNFQFIFAIGTNDSRWLVDENRHEVDQALFKANLEDITAQAEAFSEDIVFIGLLPCVESKVKETAARLGWDGLYENQYIQRYNEMIKQHCKDQEIAFVELFEKFQNEDVDALFDDGLHPNTQGHALIFDTVVNYLNETNSKTP